MSAPTDRLGDRIDGRVDGRGRHVAAHPGRLDGPGGWLAAMDAVDLAELDGRAALQTRVDRKYVLPVAQADELLAQMHRGLRVLEIDGIRAFTYESVYFDTPDLLSYRLTANGRRRRFKIRTRTYVDSGLSWVEVKTRGPRGSTIKQRMPYALEHSRCLAPGRWFVDEMLSSQSIAGHDTLEFEPTLSNRYRRSTMLLAGTGPAGDSRVTVDTDLRWQHGHRTLYRPGLAVIETKTGTVASAVDRLLWARGFRPACISKYATGLAALRPDLTATRWNRTLRRHFALPAAS